MLIYERLWVDTANIESMEYSKKYSPHGLELCCKRLPVQGTLCFASGKTLIKTLYHSYMNSHRANSRHSFIHCCWSVMYLPDNVCIWFLFHLEVGDPPKTAATLVPRVVDAACVLFSQFSAKIYHSFWSKVRNQRGFALVEIKLTALKQTGLVNASSVAAATAPQSMVSSVPLVFRRHFSFCCWNNSGRNVCLPVARLVP